MHFCFISFNIFDCFSSFLVCTTVYFLCPFCVVWILEVSVSLYLWFSLRILYRVQTNKCGSDGGNCLRLRRSVSACVHLPQPGCESTFFMFDLLFAIFTRALLLFITVYKLLLQILSRTIVSTFIISSLFVSWWILRFQSFNEIQIYYIWRISEISVATKINTIFYFHVL